MPFNCTKCEVTYKGQKMLKQHILNVHEGITFKCENCDLQFTENIKMVHHRDVEHKGLRFNCDICDYKSKSKNCLALHIRTEHEGKWHNCDLCESKFDIPSHLLAHKKLKHEGKTFPCNICNFWYDTKLKLSMHCLKKHDQAKYRCRECDYKTNGTHSLTSHKMKKHAKQDKYFVHVADHKPNKQHEVDSMKSQADIKKKQRKDIQKNKDLRARLLKDPSRIVQLVPEDYICRRNAMRDLRMTTEILDKFESLAIIGPRKGKSGVFYPREALVGHEGPRLLPMDLVPEMWIFRSLLKREREASNFPLAIRSLGMFGQREGRSGQACYFYQEDVLERCWPGLVERWREYQRITSNGRD